MTFHCENARHAAVTPSHFRNRLSSKQLYDSITLNFTDKVLPKYVLRKKGKVYYKHKRKKVRLLFERRNCRRFYLLQFMGKKEKHSMSVQYQFKTALDMSPEKEAMLRYFLGRRIVLPQYEEPEVSILIPVYNQYLFTIACLQSLVNACRGKTTYEVILADDGSTDETCHIAEHVENLRIIPNTTEKHGFLPNVNNAARSARGKYLFLLNNDTLLLREEGMLDSMTSHFTRDDVGVVGCRLLRTDGTLHDCGHILVSSGVIVDMGQPFGDIDVIESDYVEGSAIMVRMDTWRELGGFDPVYDRGYFEETDLCFRIKSFKNRRVITDMHSDVMHFTKQTFQQQSERESLFYRNGKIFMDRWHDYLASREVGMQTGDYNALALALWQKLYSGLK